jgi:hypothetical protein
VHYTRAMNMWLEMPEVQRSRRIKHIQLKLHAHQIPEDCEMHISSKHFTFVEDDEGKKALEGLD